MVWQAFHEHHENGFFHVQNAILLRKRTAEINEVSGFEGIKPTNFQMELKIEKPWPFALVLCALLTDSIEYLYENHLYLQKSHCLGICDQRVAGIDLNKF